MAEVVMDRVTLIVFLAVIVNALVEYFVKPAVDRLVTDEGWRDYILRWASAGLGVGIACVFRLNLFEGFGLPISTDAQNWASVVLTGFLMSRPSNWLADLLKQRPTPSNWGGSSTSVSVPSVWIDSDEDKGTVPIASRE